MVWRRLSPRRWTSQWSRPSARQPSTASRSLLGLRWTYRIEANAWWATGSCVNSTYGAVAASPSLRTPKRSALSCTIRIGWISRTGRSYCWAQLRKSDRSRFLPPIARTSWQWISTGLGSGRESWSWSRDPHVCCTLRCERRTASMCRRMTLRSGQVPTCYEIRQSSRHGSSVSKTRPLSVVTPI